MSQPHKHPYTTDATGFAHKVAFLDSQLRQKTLPPAQILDLLTPSNNPTILDLGAGSGYFTLPSAKRTTHPVYAVDLDPRMLALIQDKATNAQATHIQPLKADATAIPLASATINVAIASLILHELPDLDQTLAELQRLLAPNGQLLVLEYAADPAVVDGPPQHLRIGSTQLAQKLTARGFHINRTVPFNTGLYALVATKKDFA
jgi:ubiquinone/menaquinone biosynthesis C-methylase UbiE